MNTDHLINALAADTHLDAPPKTLILVATLLAVASVVPVLWGTLGFRGDLAESLVSPWSVVRFVLTGTLGLVGVRLAIMMSRPESGGLGRFWPLAAVVGAALGLVIWAYVTTPPDARQMALVGKTMVTCLVAIPLLSVVPVTAILWAMRKGATTAPAMAGFVAGVAGGGLSAMVYAMYCTEDSPLFYVTWYGLAITGVALAASVLGTKVLRW